MAFKELRKDATFPQELYQNLINHRAMAAMNREASAGAQKFGPLTNGSQPVMAPSPLAGVQAPPQPQSSEQSPILQQQLQQQQPQRPQPRAGSVSQHARSSSASMSRKQSMKSPALQNQQQVPVPPTKSSSPYVPTSSSPATIPQAAFQQQPSTTNSPYVVSAPVDTSPMTVRQLGGVSSFVDPYSYLPEEISYSDYTVRQQPLFISSVMPYGLDAVLMKLNREQNIRSSIEADLKHLKSLSSRTLDEEISLKKLKLSGFQKALRGDLVANIYYFNSVALNESNKAIFSRMKALTLEDARATETFSMQQVIERQRRENQKRLDFMTQVCNHSMDVASAFGRRKQRQVKLGRLVASMHATIEREEQKRVERTAKQRLQALRANDEEAYIKLLDQTKDTRITHLLKQTNTFLQSLTNAVKSQQNEGKATVAKEPSEEEDEDEETNDYYEVAHRVKEVVTHQPTILVGGTLKEYQLKGLQWMVSLYNNHLNGILADEMGLGKTIQSISLITYLIENKNLQGPFLVIVPLSTLTNWSLEFEKWAPSIKTVIYKGPPMARKAQQAAIRSGDFQVLLTTYEYIIKDRPVLSRVKWAHMIIDEGHRMKNTQSKLSSTLTQYYSTKYRLILTGTPLQNNLPELWALLNFVLPKIFNSVKSFDEWFNTPFANTGSQDKMDLSEEETLLIIRRLHKVLRPFLLRRLKKDVEKDLPDKVERVIKCKMSALQLKLYQQMVNHRVLLLGESVQGANTSGLKGLNNQIMQLRKICNHPYVFEEVENLVNPTHSNNEDLYRTAGKFELLDRILPKFKTTGHRVLMFFQMTQIMDIMEDYLRFKGLHYLRLDGGTKAEDRSELLKLFNAPDSPYFCFLLSTRAGGLGLNLQTADTVIIYDTDWNPHQDLQAQDRAHRIGQTKEVRILRLITENSVEENILERAHAKLEIDGKVIQAGKFDNKSTAEEQEAFLRSLLEAEEAKREHKDDDEDEDLDDEELNQVLARNDEERQIFKDLDRQRIANSASAPGGSKSRLMTEDELPSIYKEDISQHLMSREPEEYLGRGTRERKVLSYDDGLTEEQWLEAVDNDNDTIEDAIARKRARQLKRKQKAAASSSRKIDDSDGGFIDDDDDDENIDQGYRANSKKRRKVKESSATPSATLNKDSLNGHSAVASNSPVPSTIPPRKRAKGRPPKVKETLTAEQRNILTAQMEDVYSKVVDTVEEETGRKIIEIFLILPPKRKFQDYYLLMKNPVACETITKRMNNKVYQSFEQFQNDFRQMFANARVYNEEGSQVYLDACTLEEVFNKACEPYTSSAENGTSTGQDEKMVDGLIDGQQEASVANNVSAPGLINNSDNTHDDSTVNGSGGTEPVEAHNGPLVPSSTEPAANTNTDADPIAPDNEPGHAEAAEAIGLDSFEPDFTQYGDDDDNNDNHFDEALLDRI